ncbi:GNAT family N-acetyltransferase [Actinokineospora spheciospongiae]|uniref:GNAT family N-acetyltransferase n=1 Tax=Actinokineospora spheciospongiae TaxID=909613 RepID=UPI000D89D7D8|nr:GNAT family N-acetyltransferase [Actinokineospora spheciospongiae]PWW59604.1 acetyltransferase (GNAT) family protein [Actinokineospora spheciospongiae]
MAGLQRRLRVDLAGAVDQERLDRLRELLALSPRGRLTDHEDACFGTRDTGGAAPRSLALWRDDEQSWSVSLSAPRGSEVDGAELDSWAREAEAAAVAVGLRVVGRKVIALRHDGGSTAVSADGVREAAAIWARAKAHRDRDPEPATVEATAPGIRRRLSLDGAKLLLAQRDGRPAGFALVAPRERTLELFYLAVDPDAWGSGVGTRLLRDVEEHAREVGREVLELWVIDDNERAIGVYERAGWVGTDEVERDPASGRLERRFLRRVD